MTAPTHTASVAAPLYVDVHVLQTVPPSNLNRDDSGSPKQATFGGVRRARVSSQAWKRATRQAFVDLLPAQQLATRTKKISQLLAARLAARSGLDVEAAARVAAAVLKPLELSDGKKKTDETAYLLFFGHHQLERIVDLVADRAVELAATDDKALADACKSLAVGDQLSSGHPVDVALFGRMVANIPTLNVDAATQVAHALSTHAVDIEFDYFTAVDDENPKEDTGAGMIGTVEFNSATLYRYATVGVHQLVENLDGDLDAALEALRVFLIAFTRSMPTGHQNSFAQRTAPNLVTVVVRDDQPVNLVSAFEAPVRSTDGLVEESVRRLADELQRADQLWGLTPSYLVSTYTSPTTQHTGAGQITATLGDPTPFDDLVAGVVDAAGKQLAAAPTR